MFLRTIKIHWMALLLSVAVGGIYASHHFFIPLFFLDSSKEIYEPLAGDYGDEMLLYGPRAHDAFLHFGIRGDFSLAEYPRSPAILPIANPLLLGGLGKMFGSMHRGIIASDIIFPALTFFLLYLLLYEVSTSRLASLLFAALYMISPQFGISIPPISSFHLENISRIVVPFFTQSEALYFSHFDEPKLTFVFFVLFLYMTMRALKRQSRNNIILAGISFGILFYTYLYDWATAMTSLCLMVIYFFIIKDYRRFKIVGMIIAIGVCLSSYYWINVFMVRNLSTGHDIIARLGGEFSHQFRFATVWKSYARALALVVLLWVYARGHAKEAVIILGTILLSYLVVVNEQIITGFNIQPDHWYRVQFLPIAVAVFLLAFIGWRRYVASRVTLWTPIVFWTFFIFLFLGVLYGQYRYSAERAHVFAFSQPYVRGLEWLRINTKIGSVAGTLSIKGNLDLQLYTKNKIFLPFGLSTIASNEELMQRLMIISKVWDVDSRTFAAMLRGGMASYLFGDQYSAHTFDANFLRDKGHIPDDLIAKKTKDYDEFLNNASAIALPYRLDYLFVDHQEFPLPKEPRMSLPLLKKMYENERVTIFSIK